MRGPQWFLRMQKKVFPILLPTRTRRHLIFSLKIFFAKTLLLKFYFASIISVRSTPLWEKGRIRSRIREAQKHADPYPVRDPQHSLHVILFFCNYVPTYGGPHGCCSAVFTVWSRDLSPGPALRQAGAPKTLPRLTSLPSLSQMRVEEHCGLLLVLQIFKALSWYCTSVPVHFHLESLPKNVVNISAFAQVFCYVRMWPLEASIFPW